MKQNNKEGIEKVLREIGFREGEDYLAIYPYLNGKFKDRIDKADIEIQGLSVEEFKAIIKIAIQLKEKEMLDKLFSDEESRYYGIKLTLEELKQKLKGAEK